MVSDLDKEKAVAYRMMAHGMQEGVPILNVLDVGAAVVYNKILADAFAFAKEEIRHGMNLSDAMKHDKYSSLFSQDEIRAIGEGENSGDLDVAMNGLAKLLDSD